MPTVTIDSALIWYETVEALRALVPVAIQELADTEGKDEDWNQDQDERTVYTPRANFENARTPEIASTESIHRHLRPIAHPLYYNILLRMSSASAVNDPPRTILFTLRTCGTRVDAQPQCPNSLLSSLAWDFIQTASTWFQIPTANQAYGLARFHLKPEAAPSHTVCLTAEQVVSLLWTAACGKNPLLPVEVEWPGFGSGVLQVDCDTSASRTTIPP